MDVISAHSWIWLYVLDQSPYKPISNQPFSDPAIMSARLASPAMTQALHEGVYSSMSSIEGFSSRQAGYGPPPGIPFADGALSGSPMAMNHNVYGIANGTLGNLDVGQPHGSAHGLDPYPCLMATARSSPP
ncbi:uncharacterized protein FIBRA_07256 [Fibroporia radiculosa]|uniref:Uncharacterized protein n=1 Tax=Fibroporia radiculosa TaxID=599839 RepID=J4H4I5_9APHY|nr:uncharacterized protein FIBRA_07256 [Fibroporia radiculosa]CCM05054.1 predicted protein [Fibroporia radiculosa]